VRTERQPGPWQHKERPHRRPNSVCGRARDRLTNQIAHLVAIMDAFGPTRVVIRILTHEHRHQPLPRINPQISATSATPEQVADGFEQQIVARLRADQKIETNPFAQLGDRRLSLEEPCHGQIASDARGQVIRGR
jgi:hypothetical protein